MYKYIKYRNRIYHLSKQEQWKLTCEYYRGIYVKNLIEKYKINIGVSNFYLTLRLVETSTQICPYCKTNMYCIPPTKNTYHSMLKKYICKTCKHTINCGKCKCHYCFDQKQKIAFTKRQKQNSHKNSDSGFHDGLIDINELSFTEKIYLGAIIRAHLPTKRCRFTISRNNNNFAPSYLYSQEILSFLIDRGVIFQVDSSLIGVKFAINIQNICKKNQIIYDLIYPKKILNKNSEILEVVRKLQVYEAIEYFSLIAINKFSLDFIQETEIEEYFYELFVLILENNYATAQLFYFIYSALRNYAAENACSPTSLNAYTKIYNNILNLYKKAQQNNWEIQGYSRQYITKPSALFKVIAFDVLGVGENLFQSAIAT